MSKNNLKNQNGAIAIITLMVIGVFALAVMTTMSVLATSELKMSGSELASEKTFYAAEAGINEALYRLAKYPAERNFDLFDPVDVNGKCTGVCTHVDVTVPADDHYKREITSTATDITGKQRQLTIKTGVLSYGGGINYAIQTGQGGLKLDPTTSVTGDIYTNGSIIGDQNVTLYGNVTIAKGLPISLNPDPKQENFPDPVEFAQNDSKTVMAQSFKVSDKLPLYSVSVCIRKNGSYNNNINIYITKDDGGKPGSSIIISGIIKHQDLVNTDCKWHEVIFEVPPLLLSTDLYWIVLEAEPISSSRYLIWRADSNNPYNNGSALYADKSKTTWTSLSSYDMTFRIKTGIGDTFAQAIYVTKNLRAQKVDNVTADGKTFCNTPTGTCYDTYDNYCTSDPYNCEPLKFPFENDIDPWKLQAENGGVIDLNGGDYNVTDGESLGPVKIIGNLYVGNGIHLNITGNIYVTGKIKFDQHPIISLDPNLPNGSYVIIADGKIDIDNGTEILRSGDKGFIFLISLDNALDSSVAPAIDAKNGSKVIVYYAPNGRIYISNGGELNGTTGYLLHIKNGTNVIYDPNLGDVTIPPDGGETITVVEPWKEL